MNDRVKLAAVSGVLLFFVGFVVATLSMTDLGTLPEHPATTEVVSMDTIGITDAFESKQVIFTDFDPASGVPSARNTNEPLTIVKKIDETSVPLLTALDRNFLIPKLVLAHYRNDPVSGRFEPYYVVTLNNAFVVSHTTVVENMLDPAKATLPHMERVQFTYRSAQWHWLPDDIVTGTPVTCDWDSNGRVDMKDFAAMMLCASVSNVDPGKCNLIFDASVSDVVDVEDLPTFIDRLTGP